MLSGILIFNQKGENLIFRAFRTDCRPRLADVFRIQVISNAQVRSPLLTLGSTTFSHVRHENIYLVAVTKSNANAALIFEFLYRFVNVAKAYFGKFDEEAVKNNFVLIYELLDGESTTTKPAQHVALTRARNPRPRLSPEHRTHHAQTIHHNLVRHLLLAVGPALVLGGLVHHDASHRCPLLAPAGHQVPQE